MSGAARVAHAFAEIERYSESARVVLKRVLLQALTVPEIVEAAERFRLEEHLWILGRTLQTLPIRSLHVCPVLPAIDEFAQSSADQRDVAAAQQFVQSLDRPLRERVVWVLSAAQAELTARANLELLARLTALALTDLPFLLHVLEGEPADSFLEPASSPPQSASRMRVSRFPGG